MMLLDHGGLTIFHVGVVLSDSRKYVNKLVITQSFCFFFDGFVAAYTDFRLHRMGNNSVMGREIIVSNLLSTDYLCAAVWTIVLPKL
jgi:hypothetical protein